MSGPKTGVPFPPIIYDILKTDSRMTGFMRQMSQIQLTSKKKKKSSDLFYTDFKKKLP